MNNLVYLNKKARRVIGSATPIKADCGILCEKACCTRDYDLSGNELGMLLFPGEELLLRNEPNINLEKTNLRGRSAWFATCNGSCDRNKRPLSCRIFPLLAYIPKSERRKSRPRFLIIKDPRAIYTCPLLSGKTYINESFFRRVSAAAAILITNRISRRFLVLLSEIADDYLRFTG